MKSAKSYLVLTKKYIKSYEQYITLFAEIEAILNSQPLAYRPISLGNIIVTSGHFLTGTHLFTRDAAEPVIELQES